MIRLLPLILIVFSTAAVIPEYFGIGFRHILPEGPDHILFILGLFFLARDFRPLLMQMTLFTMAHSLTLGLALYGLVSVPTTAVEVAIALSIAFVAVENLAGDKLARWRPAVVFVFGLIHGLGFAHSFEGTKVATEDFLPALFSFNLGLEAGQMAVVALAYAAVATWIKSEWYRRAIAVPGSVVIAAAGVYWAVERSL